MHQTVYLAMKCFCGLVLFFNLSEPQNQVSLKSLDYKSPFSFITLTGSILIPSYVSEKQMTHCRHVSHKCRSL